MRFVYIVLSAALVSLGSLAGTTVRAQDEPYVDEAWMGVEVSIDKAPIETLNAFLGDSGTLREQFSATAGNLITFTNEGERRAHIPEVPNAEPMMVYVNAGEFVLDVMPPTSFIVQPAGGRTVTIMDISGDEKQAHYTLPGPMNLVNEDGSDCTKLCTVPPPAATGPGFAEDNRVAIQLLPGDWVIAPAGGLCVWCLLNSYAISGTTGELYVYPIMDGEFSWLTASPQASTTPAEKDLATALMALDEGDGTGGEALSSVMTWSYYNPAPNCRNG